MHPGLAALLNQTITVQAPTGVDNYGSPTGGSQSSVSARVELYSREVVNARGERVITTHRIYTQDAIGIDDLIWLPGADTAETSEARRPQRVDSHPDENGATHHYETVV